MKLPIVQYKTHRVAYTVAACFGLVPLCIGSYSLVKEDISSFWNWILLIVGLIISIRCGWMAISHILVLELNHEGVNYKKNFYGWKYPE